MKVQDILTGPDKWTQGRYAINEDGFAVGTTDPSACKFCLAGAVCKAYPDDDERASAYAKLRNAINPDTENEWRTILLFNDSPHTTFEMVREVIVKADI